MAGLQLLLCKSKERLSHTEDVAKQDSFEWPSHSLICCPNSPGVFPDLLRLSWAICWVRRSLSSGFFPRSCQIFPLVLLLSSTPTMAKGAYSGSENFLCRDGSWSNQSQAAVAISEMQSTEKPFTAVGGCLRLGEGSDQPQNRNM